MKKRLSFNKIIYFILFCSISLSQYSDCDSYNVSNICEDSIFEGRKSRNMSKKEFNDWESENINILNYYYQAYSESKSSLSGLEEQARRRLASRINVYMEKEYRRESSEDQYTHDQSMSVSHYEFSNMNLQDSEVLIVEDGGIYTVHIYKCKESYRYEDCQYKSKLSKYIRTINLKNVESIINDDYSSSDNKMIDLFHLLIESFLYVHSVPDPEFQGIKDEIYDYMKVNVLNPLSESIYIEQDDILLTPYIYFDKDITVKIDYEKINSKDFIDGFELMAVHHNGKSSWTNNYSIIGELSNGMVSLYPGMLLSNTPRQSINIYADYLTHTNSLMNLNTDFIISDGAIKELESFIRKYPFAKIEVKPQKQLPTKITFDSNLNFDTVELIKNSLTKTKKSAMSDDKEYISTFYDFNGCDNKENDCFEMNFEKSQDATYIISNLITPDKSKKKSVNLYTSDNSINDLRGPLTELHEKISKSNLNYNFCDDISVSVNGNLVDPNFNIYEVGGNTDIEIYYNYKGDNEIILDTTLLIYQDKDLVDFESLDIFNLTEKKLCYNESNINYEISIDGIDEQEGLVIKWNNEDKYKYNNLINEYVKNNDDIGSGNPLIITENALAVNEIQIRKNGYTTYSNDNVQANLNFRGQYPFQISLEKDKKFSSFFHYLLDLLIPGKGQIQFYKTSNLGKLRSLLVGIGSYYCAYEMSNFLNDYNYYNDEYNKYFDLYNNENDNMLIEEYRLLADENATLSKNAQDEVLKFGVFSGILFSVNAIEITLIHIEF